MALYNNALHYYHALIWHSAVHSTTLPLQCTAQHRIGQGSAHCCLNEVSQKQQIFDQNDIDFAFGLVNKKTKQTNKQEEHTYKPPSRLCYFFLSSYDLRSVWETSKSDLLTTYGFKPLQELMIPLSLYALNIDI